MTIFYIVGIAGMVLLLATVLLDGILDMFDVGNGILSGPAIAGFLTAFGFVGALTVYAGASGPVGVIAGTAAGAGVGALAAVGARTMMQMPTDATPGTDTMAGATGTVVTTIPADGFGEVLLKVGGQPMKCAARTTSGPLPAGTPVTVTTALSPTSVLVTPTT